MNPELQTLFEQGAPGKEAIDRFVEQSEFPLVDGKDVTFVYRGTADSVNLRCWVSGLDTAQPLQPLTDTDLWAATIEWPKGSNWVLDRKTNSLFVRSTSDALDKFEKIVAAVDIAPLQVLIEAKFIEISDGDLKDVGVEWQIAAPTRGNHKSHPQVRQCFRR